MDKINEGYFRETNFFCHLMDSLSNIGDVWIRL